MCDESVMVMSSLENCTRDGGDPLNRAPYKNTQTILQLEACIHHLHTAVCILLLPKVLALASQAPPF